MKNILAFVGGVCIVLTALAAFLDVYHVHFRRECRKNNEDFDLF